MGGGALAAPANPGPPGWLLPPYGQVERRFLRARRNELLRCEICPTPPARACTRDPPVPTHVDHTFPGQPAAVTISPLHQLTPHHPTTSPPHHLTISPPPHHTISPPHHLPTSPSPHLTISPPHNLTTSPPHHLTTSSGDRNGLLSWFLPDFGAARWRPGYSIETRSLARHGQCHVSPNILLKNTAHPPPVASHPRCAQCGSRGNPGYHVYHTFLLLTKKTFGMY